MLIDKYMAKWDIHERHEITIHTSPEQAYQAVKDLDLGRSLLTRFLFTVRGLPHQNAITLEALKSVGSSSSKRIRQPRSCLASSASSGKREAGSERSRPPNSLLSLILAR
jgi:hypothetical protein